MADHKNGKELNLMKVFTTALALWRHHLAQDAPKWIHDAKRWAVQRSIVHCRGKQNQHNLPVPRRDQALENGAQQSRHATKTQNIITERRVHQ